MMQLLTGLAVGLAAYLMIGALAACAHCEVFRQWPKGWQWVCYWRDPE